MVPPSASIVLDFALYLSVPASQIVRFLGIVMPDSNVSESLLDVFSVALISPAMSHIVLRGGRYCDEGEVP